MKNIYIDVETTGLNPELFLIRQLSYIIEIDNKVVENKVFDIEVPKDHLWNNYVKENMLPENYDELPKVSSMVAFNKLLASLEMHVNKYDSKDKFFFYAYNSRFDENFLRSFFKQHNHGYFGSYFFTPSIDIMALSAEALKNSRPYMPNFKLISVLKELNIPVDETRLHDAQYDIEMTRMLYKTLINL